MNHLRGLHAEDGPQPLAAGKNAVPHGLMDGRRILRGWREQAFQRVVGQDTAFFEYVLEHEQGSITIVESFKFGVSGFKLKEQDTPKAKCWVKWETQSSPPLGDDRILPRQTLCPSTPPPRAPG